MRILDSEALSRDVERRHLGVPASDARRVLKEQVDRSDAVPEKIHGTWLAPLWWSREILSTSLVNQ